MLRNSDLAAGESAGDAGAIAASGDTDTAAALRTATAEAQERLAALQRELAGVVEASEGVAYDESDPDGAFERAQLETLLAATEAKLQELADAGERLQAGAYGNCERCAKPIGAERLAARPTATTCIACARRR